MCVFQDKYNYYLKYICISCIPNVENAFNFKTQCEITYKKLINKIENITSSNTLIDNRSSDVSDQKDSECFEGFESDQSEFDEMLNTETPNSEKISKKSQNSKNNDEKKDQSNSTYSCDLCNRSFDAEWKIRYHIEGFHAKRLDFTCHICKAKFRYYKNMRKHRREHIRAISKEDFKTENPECSTCGVKFPNKSALKKHREKVCAKREPYLLCQFCGYTSSNRGYYLAHLNIHSKVKAFKCDKCGKGFAQKMGLRLHSVIHSDERPFGCHLCPKTFRLKIHLKNHIVTHSGAKNYKCKLCDNAYTSSSGLKIHMRIHSGEEPYQCPSCQMKFRLRRMLNSHVLKCPYIQNKTD